MPNTQTVNGVLFECGEFEAHGGILAFGEGTQTNAAFIWSKKDAHVFLRSFRKRRCPAHPHLPEGMIETGDAVVLADVNPGLARTVLEERVWLPSECSTPMTPMQGQLAAEILSLCVYASTCPPSLDDKKSVEPKVHGLRLPTGKEPRDYGILGITDEYGNQSVLLFFDQEQAKTALHCLPGLGRKFLEIYEGEIAVGPLPKEGDRLVQVIPGHAATWINRGLEIHFRSWFEKTYGYAPDEVPPHLPRYPQEYRHC